MRICKTESDKMHVKIYFCQKSYNKLSEIHIIRNLQLVQLTDKLQLSRNLKWKNDLFLCGHAHMFKELHYSIKKMFSRNY